VTLEKTGCIFASVILVCNWLQNASTVDGRKP
jgi:hypothetical protein